MLCFRCGHPASWHHAIGAGTPCHGDACGCRRLVAAAGMTLEEIDEELGEVRG